MSLSDLDFSLFGGELLFPLPSVYDNEVVTRPQDGQKTILASVYSDDEWQTNVISLGQDVPSHEAASGGLLQDWLDTPVDLLTLFAEPPTTFGIDILNEVKSESPGLDALKNLSEEIASELSTEAPAPQDRVFADTVLSGHDVYDTGLGLLELLTTKVPDESQDMDDELAGLDLIPIDSSSPILSPVSPEDVETILSSGPASPVSCTTESLQHPTILSLDDSLMDFTTMDASSITQDLWDLSRLVDQTAQEDDDKSSSSSLDQDMSEVQLLQNLSCMVKAEKEDDKSSSSLLDQDMGEVHFLQNVTLGEICQSIVKKGGGRKSRPKPYARTSVTVVEELIPTFEKPTSKTTDKKLRKKQQNKDAATRYRQKKKIEQDTVNVDLEQLEERNGHLKDKVDQMTKEIRYLKNLLVDVHKAKLKKQKGTSK